MGSKVLYCKADPLCNYKGFPVIGKRVAFLAPVFISVPKEVIFLEKLKKVAFVIGWFAISCALLALPVMLLWNWLMPEIFGLMTINFFQALGLAILSCLLFGGWTSAANTK